MLNVAVCDDSEYDIKAVKDEIAGYMAKNHINLNVEYFLKPELLLYELEDGRMYDIFILDVSMPGKDGFQLADEIRKYTETSVIIFLTSHEEQALCGYKAKALRYLIKLNLKNDFEEAMDSAVKEMSKNDTAAITLHHYNDFWRIPYKDIISVTRVSRQLVISTVSHGELTDNRGISDFFNSLDDDRFMFIDRSCFVNIDYISQIVGFDLILKNGKSLPISRRSLQNVKQTIMKHWSI